MAMAKISPQNDTMNIKELADIGAKAVLESSRGKRASWITCNPAFYEYEVSRENRETFAQAVIDVYLKTDDMLKKRVHELMDENTSLKREIEYLMVSKERQEFEAFARTRGIPLELQNGEYDDGTTFESWAAWQEARKSK